VLEMVGRERKGYNRLSISRLCNVLLEVGHRNRADDPGEREECE
jgi:hypothetical protein